MEKENVMITKKLTTVISCHLYRQANLNKPLLKHVGFFIFIKMIVYPFLNDRLYRTLSLNH